MILKLNFFDYVREREPVIYFFKRNLPFLNDSDTLYHLGTLGLIGTIKKVKHEKFFEEQVRKRFARQKSVACNILYGSQIYHRL